MDLPLLKLQGLGPLLHLHRSIESLGRFPLVAVAAGGPDHAGRCEWMVAPSRLLRRALSKPQSSPESADDEA